MVLDGEVGNSTYTDDFQAVAPERFIELYIAEQCMLGVQTGLQALGKTAFAATFGAFVARAADFVRMGAISRANLRLSGSHAGVSIGEDGPSQMALEDLALFRAVHGSTVLYPADGNATVKLVTTMCDLEGISYLRTTREATPAALQPRRGVPGRRLEDAALERWRRGDAGGRGHHPARVRSRPPTRSRTRASTCA